MGFISDGIISKSDIAEKGLHFKDDRSTKLAKHLQEYVYWMPVTGNSIPNQIKQNNLPMIQTLPANKTSHPKFVSLRYLSANSVRNKLSSTPWLFETNL